MSEYNRVYRLAGESLKAAQRLYEIATEFFDGRTVKTAGRNLADLQRDYQNLHKELFAKIDAEEPELLRKLGYYDPAVTVKTYGEDGEPRAYEGFPDITIGESKNGPVFLLYSRVDYEGQHFRPLHARAVNEAEMKISDFGDVYYDGAFMSSGSILSHPDQGTKTPANFDPVKHNHNDQYAYREGLKQKVFIASHRSRHVVEDYVRREKDFDARMKTLMDTVKTITESLYDSPYIQGKDGDDDELYTNMAIGQNKAGRPVVELSIRSQKHGGKAVQVMNNPYFSIASVKGSDIVIQPNTETEEGKALAKVISETPRRPDLSEYWQLWNPTAPTITKEFNGVALPPEKVHKAPRLEDVGGIYYLVYNISDDPTLDDHCFPPDAIAVNPAEFIWAKADREDRRMGITPPPLPNSLSYMQPHRKGVAEDTETEKPQSNDAAPSSRWGWLRRLIP